MSEVEKALQSLGNTAEEVAKSLLEKGCKGTRYRSRTCPVANFVNGLPHMQKSLLKMRVTIDGCVTWCDVQTLDPTTPEPVREFVKRFDRGEFRELCS